ncbi:metallochaperone AztD [Larkinella ripae]
MKKTTLPTRTWLVGFLAIALTACQKDDSPVKPAEGEAAFTRLLVTDAETGDITLVNPARQTSEKFMARFPGSALYPTASGRFAAVVSGANNFVQFFDSGIVDHGDHADVKGTPKWAALTLDAPKPTHTYFWGNRIVVFNDGDGSLSLTTEDELHTAGARAKVVNVDVPHHGAVVPFSNGTFAVTRKDNAVAGTLPQGVKIVDENGTVVKTATLAVTGIHGDAGNGEVALFGTTSGILVVSQDGNQRIIRYPAEFGDGWLTSVFYEKSTQTFYASAAKLGVYRIDLTANTMSPLLKTDQLQAFKVSNDGALFALLTDGTLKGFTASGTALGELKVVDAIAADAKVKPDFTITKRYAYVTDPAKNRIIPVLRDGFTAKTALPVSGKPSKIAVIGAQQERAGDD